MYATIALSPALHIEGARYWTWPETWTEGQSKSYMGLNVVTRSMDGNARGARCSGKTFTSKSSNRQIGSLISRISHYLVVVCEIYYLVNIAT